jgi:sec-independent protein translocase protein TatA
VDTVRIGPFGTWEIILILVVVMLLFGAKRLPDMARGIGQSVREFRRAIKGHDEAEETPAAPSEAATAAPPPAQERVAEPVDRR